MRRRPAAGPAHVAVADHGRQVVDRVSTTGPAVHLDVAESVEGEKRLPHLVPFPRQRVLIGGLGQPQRPQREFAVHVEYLGMPQGHDVARGTGDLDTYPTRDVLPEIQHAAPGRCQEGLDRCHRLDPPDRLGDRRART